MTTTTPMPPDAALSIRGVWKVFGDHRAFGKLPRDRRTAADLAGTGLVGAVRDVSLDIMRGEVFVLMGLSGSGKSTLLRCMTRLIDPTEGAVFLNGQDLCKADERTLVALRRRHMGMVFQNFALLPNRTVLGNIAFPLEVQGAPQAQAQKRARELIETVGLTGREDRYPAELSGGQQQRVGIARSLATDPDFWFLDEPFSALDPLIRADLQGELLRLQGALAKTVVFVTHDLDEAIRIADRIAIMENGEIVQIDTPERLVIQPINDYVRRFVAKVAPATVIRVSSLMEPLDGGGAEGVTPLPAHATLDAVGPRLLDGPAYLPVVDALGVKVGCLDRARALAILAGGTRNAC